MKSSDRFIKRIKEEKIRPKPLWMFASKNILIWAMVLLTILLGAVAFSIVLFAIQQIEFNLISHMSHSRLEMWLSLLPFVWIISLILVLLVSIFGIRKTRKGYKFPLVKIVSISVLGSLLLGSLFFIGGGAQWLENAFAVELEFYESVEEKKEKMWSLPDEGYLSGTIIMIKDTTIRIRTHKNEVWEVSLNEATIFTLVEIIEGERIKLVGRRFGDNYFQATEVRPWGGFGRKGGRWGQNRKQGS